MVKNKPAEKKGILQFKSVHLKNGAFSLQPWLKNPGVVFLYDSSAQ